MKNKRDKPLISVIVEGYNDSLELGTVDDTMAALKEQNFPTGQIEVILVGNIAQTKLWKEKYAGDNSFWAVLTVGKAEGNYYQLKNEGAKIASADILALIDSDVIPENNWLTAIYEKISLNGAEATAGVSLFRDNSGFFSTNGIFLRIAASISWGFVVPKEFSQTDLVPNAFVSHNFAIRKEVFRKIYFREDFGRTMAGSFFLNELRDLKADFRFNPKQKVAHSFTPWWWLSRLHFRSGYEIYRLRRIDPQYPNKFLTKFSVVEPITSFFWNIMLDVPRWFRFSRFLDFGLIRQLVYLPLVIFLSCLARLAESTGMYATMFSAETMRKIAEQT